MINLLYIDDELDNILCEFLNNIYNYDGEEINFYVYQFKTNQTYQELISSKDVSRANIIIIDSRLFENNNVEIGKFTGDEFKALIKKIYPYIEVIIITQNEDETIFKVKKFFNQNNDPNPITAGILYYKDKLTKYIDEAIKNVNDFKKMINTINNNSVFDKYLKENLNNLFNGIVTYNELKKEDIDELINSYKEIRGIINDK